LLLGYPYRRAFCIGCDPTLTRFDRKFSHFFGWAFVPVANAIFDVVKVLVFWVVSDPGGDRCNTMPEVAIGTSGVEYAAVRIH